MIFKRGLLFALFVISFLCCKIGFDKEEKSQNPLIINNNLNPLINSRDSCEVYVVLKYLLEDTINPHRMPCFDYDISHQDFSSLLMELDNSYEKDSILIMLNAFFYIDSILSYPIKNNINIYNPLYFEEVISEEKQLSTVLNKILNSDERSWTSLSTRESIVLRYNIIFYLMNIEVDNMYGIIGNYYTICSKKIKH